jgi:hypothetical protein
MNLYKICKEVLFIMTEVDNSETSYFKLLNKLSWSLTMLSPIMELQSNANLNVTVNF